MGGARSDVFTERLCKCGERWSSGPDRDFIRGWDSVCNHMFTPLHSSLPCVCVALWLSVISASVFWDHVHVVIVCSWKKTLIKHTAIKTIKEDHSGKWVFLNRRKLPELSHRVVGRRCVYFQFGLKGLWVFFYFFKALIFISVQKQEVLARGSSNRDGRVGTIFPFGNAAILQFPNPQKR